MPLQNELNNKEEMLKRLSYVFYVIVLFFSFCFALMAIATWQGSTALTATLLGICAYTLRKVGARYLDFPRLAISFPMGVPEDVLSKESRVRFEGLIDSFYSQVDWTVRQDIRQRIAEMVYNEPLLVGAFHQEIKAVHPTLFVEMTHPA